MLNGPPPLHSTFNIQHSSSPLHDRHRLETRDLAGDAGPRDDVHHSVDVLVRFGRLLTNPLVDAASATMPIRSSRARSSLPSISFFARMRDITRPAPWHDEPKVSRIDASPPASRYDAVPMLPGMSTGCPGKARVAPLRCTTILRPSYSSLLATLCATS